MSHKTYYIIELQKRMTNYNIEFYSKGNGEEPAREFILRLDPKMQAKILKILDLLQVNGPYMRLPYSEHHDRSKNSINQRICKKDTKNTKVGNRFS